MRRFMPPKMGLTSDPKKCQGVESRLQNGCTTPKAERMLRHTVETGAATPDVRHALERIVSSTVFRRNERHSRFLRFLVERSLEGREAELKESVIGVEVFGREAGYDPKIDGIVRTEAVRLRSRLNQYYAGEGAQDPCVIDLPKGGYRPVFRERAALETKRRPWRGGKRWWIAGAIAALALAVTGATWWRGRVHSGPYAVAVLPLENIGHDAANEYFADGLTDEIIRNLSLIDGLTVPSRTSTFALKGKSLTAGEAGKQLRADYLLEGSVLYAGDQLRVTIALIRVRDEYRLWSDRFDRKLTDVFSIQDEISRGVVNSLRLKLNSGQRRYDTNLEAYDLYLRGRHAMEGFPAVGRMIGLSAVRYFEEAIARDPNYAIAYAGLADTLLAMDENVIRPDYYARAKTAAGRAVELDPMLSEAQSSAASIAAREYRWPDAERGFRRAIELNPNNALAHLQLGFTLLVGEGRVDAGLQEVRRAADLDPLSPYMSTELGHALLLARQYPEAVNQLRKAIEQDLARNRPRNFAARALYLQGKTGESMAMFDEIVKHGNPRGGPNWLTCADVRAGRRDEADSVLRQQLASGRPARELALAYACVDDEEHALELLEKAVAERQPGLPALLQSPELSWLRRNPRFEAIRKQLNLPSETQSRRELKGAWTA
jgi:serine/threonine-protein kinase